MTNTRNRDIDIYEIALKKAYTALEELKKYNRLHNDLDAYLLAVAEWGLMQKSKKPKPEDYGL